MPPASGPWSDAEVRQLVARTAGTRALAQLLREEHALYAGCGAADVACRRGWVMVQLVHQARPAGAPLDEAALPFVLEELQTGHLPYLLAAAAFALRHASVPAPSFAAPLVRAAELLLRRDDTVDLARWGGVGEDGGPTALDEVLATLAWAGATVAAAAGALRALLRHAPAMEARHRAVLDAVARRADAGNAQDDACCTLPLAWRRRTVAAAPAAAHGILLQDQDGQAHSWPQLLAGRPSVVAFFYTRCDNELKCSLTVSRLAQVQQLAAQAGLQGRLRIAAITYDPDFDLPARLRGYALSRGIAFGADCLFLRAVQDWDALRQQFALGVNFAGGVVNRHRTELFVLDAQARIAVRYERLGWTAQEVVDDLRLQLQAAPASAPAPVAAAAGAASAPAWSLLLALLPKCPLCGATYLSLGGIGALPTLPGWTRLWPLLALLLVLNLASLAWLARQYRSWIPFAWSAAGAALLLGGGLALDSGAAAAGGVLAVVLGSLLAVRSVRPAWRHGFRAVIQQLASRLRPGRPVP